MCIGLIWLMVWSSVRILSTQLWTFGFHKGQLISWLSEGLLTSKEGVTELFLHFGMTSWTEKSAYRRVSTCIRQQNAENCPERDSNIRPISSVPMAQDRKVTVIRHLTSLKENIYLNANSKSCLSQSNHLRSLCFDWALRREGVLGEWRYNSTHFLPRL
jgi:hypothetical protein